MLKILNHMLKTCIIVICKKIKFAKKLVMYKNNCKKKLYKVFSKEQLRSYIKKYFSKF